MSALPQARWRKVGDDWLLEVEGPRLPMDASVEIVKRDGTSERRRVFSATQETSTGWLYHPVRRTFRRERYAYRGW